MRLKTKRARLREAMSRMSWASLTQLPPSSAGMSSAATSPADATDADDGDGAVGVARPGPERGLHDAGHLLRDLDDDRGGVDEPVPDEPGRLRDRGADELLAGRDAGEAHRGEDELAVLGDGVALVVVRGALDDGGRDRDPHLLVAALDDPRHRPPLLSRIAAVTWSHEVTGRPSTETMRSRSCSPAALAGATGSPGLHCGCGTCRVGAAVGTQAERSPTLGATSEQS